MKPSFLLWSAVLLCGTLSCAKPLPFELSPDGEHSDDDLVTVVFRITDATKITGVSEDNERSVQRWAVIAFDSDGERSSRTASFASEIPMNLHAGHEYTVCAVVNYPVSGVGAFNPDAVRTPADLSDKVAYLTDNQEDALIMYGSVTCRPEQTGADEPPVEKSIGVTRLVSRIDIKQLSVDFSASSLLDGKTLTLRHIYITNAYRTSRYGSDYPYAELSASRTAWYNTMGWHRGESADAAMDRLLGERDLNIDIASGQTYQTAHSFYAFPNPTAKEDDSTDIEYWEKRSTRLVLACEIEGTLYYYPIRLPSMKRNTIYSAENIVITGLGSLDEELLDIPPESCLVDLSIGSGWNEGGETELN